MHSKLQDLLDAEDDPALWALVLETILGDAGRDWGTVIEIGRCSHWLRPHQTRWTADGGFAWPSGYGSGGYSRNALPQFDRSVLLRWTGTSWESARTTPGSPDVRVAIPARTTRHRQAAIHTRWSCIAERTRFYGFRNRRERWELTAVSDRCDRAGESRDLRRAVKSRNEARRLSRESKFSECD
jgi:hypothetical protein